MLKGTKESKGLKEKRTHYENDHAVLKIEPLKVTKQPT